MVGSFPKDVSKKATEPCCRKRNLRKTFRAYNSSAQRNVECYRLIYSWSMLSMDWFRLVVQVPPRSTDERGTHQIPLISVCGIRSQWHLQESSDPWWTCQKSILRHSLSRILVYEIPLLRVGTICGDNSHLLPRWTQQRFTSVVSWSRHRM